MIIDTFGPGKNITPVDNTTYLFRPESPLYYHKIIVFSLHSQVPEKVCDIIFPTDLPWGKWKIGTTMSPIWITENDALMIFHGISIKIIDGVEKYIYSIGRAKLTRHGNSYSVIVAQDPILTPDNFLKEDGTPLVDELHPEIRKVVYSCGGIMDKNAKDRLSLFVNVGDRTTFEVDFSINELKEGLF